MGKSRLDVWNPSISPVNSSGIFQETALTPEKWIKCETLGGQRRAANALTSVEITDELYMPRTVKIELSNACPDFRAGDNEVYEHVYKDSEGANAFSSAVYLRKKWGPFSYFFEGREFIRIVDEDTGYVHFAGQLTNVHKEYAQGRGLLVTLNAIDSLAILKQLTLDTMGSEYRFKVNKRRSQLIHFLIRMAQSEFLMNPDLWYDEFASSESGASDYSALLHSQYYDPYSASSSASLVTYDANPLTEGIGLNGTKRFENSTWFYRVPLYFQPKESTSVTLLDEIQRLAINEPHENESGLDHFGFTFYADPNISSQVSTTYRAKNLDPATPPPPQQFNYFRRGHRLAVSNVASGEPETYGLRAEMPVSNQTESGRTYTRKASRRIAGNFGVDSPTDEVFTHALVKMNTMEDDLDNIENFQDEDLRRNGGQRTVKFEIFYVNHFSKGGTGSDKSFAWRDLPTTDEYDIDQMMLAGQDPTAAEYVHVLDADGNTILSYAARIQYMADETEDSAEFTHILLSDLNRKVYVDPGTGTYVSLGGTFPTENASGDDYVILKGVDTNATCRLNLNSTNPAKGRPSKVLGGERPISMTLGIENNVEKLRQDVASKLSSGIFPIARTKFSLSRHPNYWIDLEIHTNTTISTGGQRIQCKLQGDSGISAIQLSPYGVREGMLVTKMDSTYTNRIVKANNKPVFGYIYNMETNGREIDLDLTESQSFSNGDKLRIHVPVRAGDTILMDNPLIQMYGNHAVSKTVYRENHEGMSTEFHTYGLNERKSSGGGVWHSSTGTPSPQPEQLVTGGSTKGKGTLLSLINTGKAVSTDMSNTVFSRKAHFGGPLPVTSKAVTFTYPQSNRIEWTAGRLVLGDGSSVKIKASGSGSTSGTSDTTYGLGSNGMTGTNEYMMYVDFRDANSVNVEYNIRTTLYATFRDIIAVDRVVPLFKVRAGNQLPYVENHANFIPETGTTPIKWEAYQFVQPASITGALIASTTLTGANLVNNTITETQIGDNEISVGKLKANSVGTNQLIANAITTGKILAGAIVTDRLDANAVTAAKIDAGAIEAEAMSANALDAYIITLTGAGMLRTGTITLSGTGAASWALSGAGIAINQNGIFGASGSGTDNMEFFIQASDGKAMFGGGVCTIGNNGIYIPNSTVDQLGSIQFQHHTGGGSTFIYKRGSANNLLMTATGSTGSTAGSANALLLINMWLGNNDFRLDRVVTDYVRIHAAASSGPSSPGTDKGELFVLDGDDGLWWKFEGNTPVDLTSSGSSGTLTNNGSESSPALQWSNSTSTGLRLYKPTGTYSAGTTMPEFDGWPNPNVTQMRLVVGGEDMMYLTSLDYSANAIWTSMNKLVICPWPIQTDVGIIFTPVNGHSWEKTVPDDVGGTNWLGSTTTIGGVQYSANDKGILYCEKQTASGPGMDDDVLFWQGSETGATARRLAYIDEVQALSGVDCFKYIAASGQANVPAQNGYDTLTLVAANGITLATNSTARSVTIGLASGGFSDPLRLNAGGATNPTYSFNTGGNYSGMWLDISSNFLGFSYEGTNKIKVFSYKTSFSDQIEVISLATSGTSDVYRNSNSRLSILASTRRIKDDIRPLELDTSKIWDIDVHTYDLKRHELDGNTLIVHDDIEATDFGLIAEELEEVIPGMTTKDDTGQPLSIINKNLIMVLLAETKKLRARIEALEGS